MKPARLRGPALILVAFLPACMVDSEGGEGKFTVRDSAGIQIVENREPLWEEGRGWTLSSEPIVSIGAVNGRAEYLFAKVTGAVRLSDGRIAVADEGSASIRLYDPTGVHLRSVGAKGGGPGEFQSLTWLWKLPGDSLVAYDSRQLRTSAYDASGKLVRMVSLSIPRRGHLVRGRFGDGTLLTTQLRSSPSELSGPRRDTIDFFRVSRDGTRLNPVATLSGDEEFLQIGRGRGTPIGGIAAVASPIFFGRSTKYVAEGARLFAGDNDAPQVGVYAQGGRLERLIRWPGVPRPVRQRDVDSMIAARLARSGIPAATTLLQKMFAEMPIPETMPAFDRIVADGSGDLWVEEYRVKGSGSLAGWTVFDPEGRMLGTVQVPDEFSPLEIGKDYVLGVWTDDVDVQSIRLYRLARTPNPDAGAPVRARAPENTEVVVEPGDESAAAQAAVVARSAAAEDSLERGLPLGPPLGQVFLVSDLDVAPRFSSAVSSAALAEELYPPALKAEAVGGPVLLEFVIREDGRVFGSSIKVLDSPHPGLTGPSIAVAKRFGFRPGRRGEERVATRMQMPFTWDPAW
jgi:hypothetical protein